MEKLERKNASEISEDDITHNMKMFEKPPPCFWPIGTVRGWKGPTEFSNFSTVDDVLDDCNHLDGKPIDLTRKVVVVIGSTRGLGKITAISAFRRNANVIFACRDNGEPKSVAAELNTTCKEEKRAFALDLASFQSVKAFCAKMKNEWQQFATQLFIQTLRSSHVITCRIAITFSAVGFLAT